MFYISVTKFIDLNFDVYQPKAIIKFNLIIIALQIFWYELN